MLKKTWVSLLASLSLTACADVRLGMGVYQATSVVDMTQTIHMAREPMCWKEANVYTRYLVGEHPTEKAVVAVMLSYATIQWIAAYKIFEVSKVAYYAFQAASIYPSVRVIHRNHQLGLRPFGTGCEHSKAMNLRYMMQYKFTTELPKKGIFEKLSFSGQASVVNNVNIVTITPGPAINKPATPSSSKNLLMDRYYD